MHDDPVASPLDAPTRRWPRWKRVGFRFLAVYFVLYTFPFPLDFLPWIGDAIGQGVSRLWKLAAVWVGHAVFGIEEEIFTGFTGSGDTTVDYLRLLIILLLAAAATLLWSWLDRRRPAYPRASHWLVVGCRVYLGLVMLSYGLVKIIPTQFPPPGLTRLLQTYGSSSPMGLVWTWMGLSPAYEIFTGLAEAVPACLLFFRRTRLLGALLASMVLTNVVLLNYAFDVPVKLFSSHLLAMALALVLLDAGRLADFFLRQQPVAPAPPQRLFVSRRLDLAATAVGVLLVGSFVVRTVSAQLDAYHQWGAGRPKPEIWGIHDVESFRADGQELPALLSDEVRWRALVVDRALPVKWGELERPGRIAVQHMDGTISYHAVELDEAADTLTLIPEGHDSLAAARAAGAEIPGVLRYERSGDGRMVVRGSFEGRQIEVELHERAPDDMLLVTRGYHWINEQPFNR